MTASALIGLSLALLVGMPIEAAVHLRLRAKSKAIKTSLQRRRFQIEPEIASPTKLEVEVGSALDSSYRSLPVNLRYTPGGRSQFWHKTELSAAFETVAASKADDHFATHTGDRLSLAANHLLFEKKGWEAAVSPKVDLLFRNGKGARAGATAVGNYTWGKGGTDNLGMHVTWDAATHASELNPAGSREWGGGYLRKVRKAGLYTSATRYSDTLGERVTTVLVGMNYALSERLNLDGGVSRFRDLGVWDNRVVFGFTWVSGRTRH